MNVWDDGYPSGGNFWSDYVGVDVKSGPNQDLPGSDGIGDTPYVIDVINRDRYPLMNPYGAPPPQTYSLVITATVGGTTSPAPGTYTYPANSKVEITAIPNTGYPFDYWELDGANVGSANPYTVTMDKNHTLKAVFSPPIERKPGVKAGDHVKTVKPVQRWKVDRKLSSMVFRKFDSQGKTKQPCVISNTDENGIKPICERCGIACYAGAYSGLFLSDTEWLRMFKVAKRVAPFKNKNEALR